MGRSHSGPTVEKKLPRMRKSRRVPSKHWKTGTGGTPGSKAAKGGAAAKISAEANPLPGGKLPRLNKAGDSLRASPVPKAAIVASVVEEAVAAPVPDKIDPELLPQIRGKGPLSLEEKVFILEHRFSKAQPWGDLRIAKALQRPRRTVTEFIERYRSTNVLAKAYLEREAENLAKRIARKANVEQSMEVLDRLDVLPKKDRKAVADQGGPQFSIIIGQSQGAHAIPVPDQKAIEAALVNKE